jgi:hypothetical protein
MHESGQMGLPSKKVSYLNPALKDIDITRYSSNKNKELCN